jgi:hypothetical protein
LEQTIAHGGTNFAELVQIELSFNCLEIVSFKRTRANMLEFLNGLVVGPLFLLIEWKLGLEFFGQLFVTHNTASKFPQRRLVISADERQIGIELSLQQQSFRGLAVDRGYS